jgi:hypothetical protein
MTTLGVTALLAVSSSGQAVGLKIIDYRGQQTLGCVNLVDQSFSLSFIHSVSLTPVIDEYHLLNTDSNYRILQTAERFFAHGQGLPSLVDEPDAIAFEHTDGQFILKLKRNIDNLIVRTDSRFKNRLHTGSITIDLNQWPDNGLKIYPVEHCLNTTQ